MRIVMVKKQLASGEPCAKCIQTEQLLRRRGFWERIDDVVWAIEGQPESPGMRLSARLDVERAPFFVVTEESEERVYTSALALIKKCLAPTRDPVTTAGPTIATSADGGAPADGDATPMEVLRGALEGFGADCGIAFSGAEDVVLVDMAAATGLPFSVFCLDTGRLHDETHRFIEDVRARYSVNIALYSPQAEPLERFVRDKGLFSFLQDGHSECCGVRKVEPLGRALSGLRAWVTGQRRDQNPATRRALLARETDTAHRNADGAPLIKFNPLASWSAEKVWDYIREYDVPFNPLHLRGFRSIGCAPCTRPVLPHQHERDGRWWWERAEAKECGLHDG